MIMKIMIIMIIMIISFAGCITGSQTNRAKVDVGQPWSSHVTNKTRRLLPVLYQTYTEAGQEGSARTRVR